MSSAATKRSWTERAACREEPVRRFTHPSGPADVRKARKTCATCRVRETCLNVALTHPVHADAGIWGGTTEAQRRHIRQGRLTVAEALQDEPGHRRSEPTAVTEAKRPATAKAAERTRQRPNAPQRVERRPRVTVHRDPYGDYTDDSGRVLIFEIHGDPPYMLMIDRRPVIRTATVREAAQHAWSVLNRRDHTHTKPRAEVPGPNEDRPARPPVNAPGAAMDTDDHIGPGDRHRDLPDGVEQIGDLARRYLQQHLGLDLDGSRELPPRPPERPTSPPSVGAEDSCSYCASENVRFYRPGAPEDRQQITSPEAAAEILVPMLQGLDREHCVTLNLDTKHRLIAATTVSIGSIDHTFMSPREVYRDALLHGAAAVVIAHNHPSGDAEPSRDDELVTRRLHKAGEIVGIDVLDHMVIGHNRWTSLARRGLLADRQADDRTVEFHRASSRSR